jgi:hypothetical protein
MSVAALPVAAEHGTGVIGARQAETAADRFAAASRREWHRTIGIGLAAYVISRILVYVGSYAQATQEVSERQSRFLPVPGSVRVMIENVLWRWDGKWYKIIADEGYPRQLATFIRYDQGSSASVAFFPVYPMLARWFDLVFPGNVFYALLGLNVVLSAIAVVLVGMIARDLYDLDTARRAMILFCVFPGAVTLSWSYAEPSLIVCAAACFLCLHRERWILAGVFSAIGTATRPNAIGLVAACGVAALLVIWKRRQWRALVSVVLAPLGVFGYHLFLTHHTGESGAWMRAQREAWDEGYSWGATAVRFTWRFLENPLGSWYGGTYMHTALALFALAIGAYCAVVRRVPLPMLAYAAGVAALMVMPATVSARPRFVFAAFPLVFGVAAWLPRRRRYLFEGVVVLSAGSMVVFTLIYGSYAVIP